MCDMWIAACCLTNYPPLATLNVNDYLGSRARLGTYGLHCAVSILIPRVEGFGARSKGTSGAYKRVDCQTMPNVARVRRRSAASGSAKDWPEARSQPCYQYYQRSTALEHCNAGDGRRPPR